MENNTCKFCGSPLENDAKFCPGCGNEINAEKAKDSQNQNNSQPQPVNPIQSRDQQQYNQGPHYPPNQQFQAPQYQQPPYQQNYNPNYPPMNYPPVAPNYEELEKPLSLGNWVLTIIICSLPLVGFIMTLVWAFGDGNKGRRNFMRASLLLSVISAVLVFILFFVIAIFSGSVLASLTDVVSSF